MSIHYHDMFYRKTSRPMDLLQIKTVYLSDIIISSFLHIIHYKPTNKAICSLNRFKKSK